MASRLLRIVSLFSLLFAGLAVQAQILTPVKWDVRSEITDGKTYLVFDAKIDEGWTVYSQYLESDDGPVATTINYDTPDAVKLIGKAEESGKRKAGYDKLFDMEVVKFSKTYSIRQEVQFTGDAPVVGYLNFMTCDSEKCLPPSDVEFEINRPTSPSTGSIEPEAQNEAVKKKQSSLTQSRSPEKTADVAQLSTSKKDPTAPAKSIFSVPEEKAAEESGAAPQKGLLNPVKWSFSLEQIEGTRYWIHATAAIQKDWTVYSQEVDPGGPVATSFGFEKVEEAKLFGKVEEKGNKKSGLDPVFEVNVTKFVAPEATFSQEVQIESEAGMIAGYLEFMSCDKSQCLPPSERYFQFIPAKGIARELEYDQYESVLAGNPVDPNTPSGGDAADPNAQYLIDKKLETATCGEDSREVDVAEDASWFTIFFLGFGGGLLALLTPCVFPMIPLTVSFFTGRGKDRKKGLQRALIYGASIIAIYVTLGLVSTGVFGGDALNMLSTNDWFNLAFGVLFIVFALSFFWFFEFTFPSSWL